MSSISALATVLLWMILEAAGQGVGYTDIQQPPTSSQVVGGVRPSRQPARAAAKDSDDVGEGSRVLYSQRGARTAKPLYDWDLEQRLTETAPTQHLGTVDSESAVASHAMSYFAIHGGVKDTRYHVPGFQRKEQNKQQHKHHQHRVPLRNMDNVQYFGDMMIGEPPQRMKVSGNTVFFVIL